MTFCFKTIRRLANAKGFMLENSLVALKITPEENRGSNFKLAPKLFLRVLGARFANLKSEKKKKIKTMRARNVDDDDDLHLQNQATKTENNKYDLSAPKTLNLTTKPSGPVSGKSLNVVSRIHKQLLWWWWWGNLRMRRGTGESNHSSRSYCQEREEQMTRLKDKVWNRFRASILQASNLRSVNSF